MSTGGAFAGGVDDCGGAWALRSLRELRGADLTAVAGVLTSETWEDFGSANGGGCCAESVKLAVVAGGMMAGEGECGMPVEAIE